MKRIETRALISLVAAIALTTLAGCSGVGSGSGPGPGPQNANLALTMTSKPSVSLTNISVLSAAVGITGVALNPSTGTAVSVTLSPTVYPVDLARLQSDTAFLGSLSLPAATYTSATLTFSAPVLTILNQTGGTLNGTCLSGTICHIVLTAGSAQVISAPFPLTLTSGQATGVSINLDLNTALTVTSGTLALNFSTANVATAATLRARARPRARWT